MQYEALGFLLGGLGFFGLLGVLANVNDKASKKPYVRAQPVLSQTFMTLMHLVYRPVLTR